MQSPYQPCCGRGTTPSHSFIGAKQIHRIDGVCDESAQLFPIADVVAGAPRIWGSGEPVLFRNAEHREPPVQVASADTELERGLADIAQVALQGGQMKSRSALSRNSLKGDPA